jgi:hypothetical protein
METMQVGAGVKMRACVGQIKQNSNLRLLRKL